MGDVGTVIGCGSSFHRVRKSISKRSAQITLKHRLPVTPAKAGVHVGGGSRPSAWTTTGPLRPVAASKARSSAGDGEVVDAQGRGIGAGFEFEIVGGDEAGENFLQIGGYRHLADRGDDLGLLCPE